MAASQDPADTPSEPQTPRAGAGSDDEDNAPQSEFQQKLARRRQKVDAEGDHWTKNRDAQPAQPMTPSASTRLSIAFGGGVPNVAAADAAAAASSQLGVRAAAKGFEGRSVSDKVSELATHVKNVKDGLEALEERLTLRIEELRTTLEDERSAREQALEEAQKQAEAERSARELASEEVQRQVREDQRRMQEYFKEVVAEERREREQGISGQEAKFNERLRAMQAEVIDSQRKSVADIDAASRKALADLEENLHRLEQELQERKHCDQAASTAEAKPAGDSAEKAVGLEHELEKQLDKKIQKLAQRVSSEVARVTVRVEGVEQVAQQSAEERKQNGKLLEATSLRLHGLEVDMVKAKETGETLRTDVHALGARVDVASAKVGEAREAIESTGAKLEEFGHRLCQTESKSKEIEVLGTRFDQAHSYWGTTIEQFNARLTETASECRANIGKEATQLEARCNTLLDQFEDMKASQSKALTNLEAVREQMVHHESDTGGSSAKGALEQMVAELTTRMEDVGARVQRHEETQRATSERLDRDEPRMRALEDYMRDATKSRDSDAAQLHFAKTRLDAWEQDRNELRAMFTAKSDQVDKLEASCSQIEGLVRTSREHAETLQTASSQWEQASAQLEALSSQVLMLEVLSGRMDDLDKSTRSLQDTASRADIASQVAKLDALSSRVDNIAGVAEANTARLEKEAAVLQDVSSQVVKLDASCGQIEGLARTTHQLTENVQATASQWEQASAQLEALSSQVLMLEVLSGRMDDLDKSTRSLKDTATRADVASQVARLDALSSRLDEVGRMTEASAAQLEKESAALQEVSSQVVKLDSSCSQIEDLARTSREHADNLQTVSSQWEQASAQLEALSSQVLMLEVLSGRMDDLDKSTRSLKDTASRADIASQVARLDTLSNRLDEFGRMTEANAERLDKEFAAREELANRIANLDAVPTRMDEAERLAQERAELMQASAVRLDEVDARLQSVEADVEAKGAVEAVVTGQLQDIHKAQEFSAAKLQEVEERLKSVEHDAAEHKTLHGNMNTRLDQFETSASTREARLRDECQELVMNNFNASTRSNMVEDQLLVMDSQLKELIAEESKLRCEALAEEAEARDMVAKELLGAIAAATSKSYKTTRAEVLDVIDKEHASRKRAVGEILQRLETMEATVAQQDQRRPREEEQQSQAISNLDAAAVTKDLQQLRDEFSSKLESCSSAITERAMAKDLDNLREEVCKNIELQQEYCRKGLSEESRLRADGEQRLSSRLLEEEKLREDSQARLLKRVTTELEKHQDSEAQFLMKVTSELEKHKENLSAPGHVSDEVRRLISERILEEQESREQSLKGIQKEMQSCLAQGLEREQRQRCKAIVDLRQKLEEEKKAREDSARTQALLTTPQPQPGPRPPPTPPCLPAPELALPAPETQRASMPDLLGYPDDTVDRNGKARSPSNPRLSCDSLWDQRQPSPSGRRSSGPFQLPAKLVRKHAGALPPAPPVPAPDGPPTLPEPAGLDS